eukprot:6180488-Pleurochrysis_carterae.AAC.2
MCMRARAARRKDRKDACILVSFLRRNQQVWGLRDRIEATEKSTQQITKSNCLVDLNTCHHAVQQSIIMSFSIKSYGLLARPTHASGPSPRSRPRVSRLRKDAIVSSLSR